MSIVVQYRVRSYVLLSLGTRCRAYFVHCDELPMAVLLPQWTRVDQTLGVPEDACDSNPKQLVMTPLLNEVMHPLIAVTVKLAMLRSK